MNLREIRERSGLGQQEFSKRYGFSIHRLRRIEQRNDIELQPIEKVLIAIISANKPAVDAVIDGVDFGLPRYEGYRLPWAILVGGFKLSYDGLPVPDDISGLSDAIVRHMLTSNYRLAGSDLTFLRSHYSMDYEALAERIGVGAATVANWESDESKLLSGPIDLSVRLVFASMNSDPSILFDLRKMDKGTIERKRGEVFFSRRDGAWVDTASGPAEPVIALSSSAVGARGDEFPAD